jgi:hypothetical protein
VLNLSNCDINVLGEVSVGEGSPRHYLFREIR